MVGGRITPPPFLAILAFFSIVAERMRSDDQFRANNYYGRLAQALRVRDTSVRCKLERDFRHDSSLLWDGLSSWLLLKEGRLGLPTAFAFDWRSHIGRPMSQALVSDQDRRRFKEAFSDFGLDPGPVALTEMEELLDGWLPLSSASTSLKGLWGVRDARERINAVACLELEAWDGLRESQFSPTADLPIRLVGSLIQMPTPRLELGLRVRSLEGAPVGSYMLATDHRAPNEAGVLRGPESPIELIESSLETWYEFDDQDRVSIPDALIQHVRLESSDQQRPAVTRAPKRLITLLFDPEARWYREVPRARLGERHLLIGHSSLQKALESVLDKVARPGWQLHTAGELAGCPVDWIVVSDVRIGTVADDCTYDDDTQQLYPLGTASVSLDGGFRMPGRSTFHRDRPPRVIVTLLDGQRGRLRLVPVHSTDDATARFLGTHETVAEIDLGELGALEHGEYRLALVAEKAPDRDGALLDSAPARFVSAAAAPTESRPSLAHALQSDPLGALGASESWEGSDATVAGARVGSSMTPGSTEGPLPPAELGALAQAEPDDVWFSQVAVRASRSSGTSCLLGSHHWMLESVQPGSRRPVHGECRNCGAERWHGRRRPRHASIRKVVRKQAARSLPRLATRDEEADFALLIDALTWLGGGPWDSFARLASQIDDSPWFPMEAARDLSALGHLDIELDPATLRPRSWSIAPPTLAMTSSGTAVLCGARIPSLTEAICEDARSLGAEIVDELSARGLRTIGIKGLPVDDVHLLASVVSTDQADVGVSVQPALQILDNLPPVSEIASELPETQLPAGVDVWRWAPESRKWTEVEKVGELGVFRFRTSPARFGFRRASDSSGMRTVDSRLGKLLAAVEDGVSPVAYDPGTARLFAARGAQLPGLYERAIVLCSGHLPTDVDGLAVAYREVPETVARLLWSKLSA